MQFLKKYILLIVLLQLSHFSPLYSPHPAPPTHQNSPTLFHVIGYTSKFFGFSISLTILNLPMSILYLSFMLLIPCTFSPIFPLPFPADNLPCDLHFCDSVPILAIHLFCFCFLLGSVVDSCEFVVILLFIFFIFLEKSV